MVKNCHPQIIKDPAMICWFFQGLHNFIYLNLLKGNGISQENGFIQ